jgi:serine/threonine-protein kinase
VEAGFRLAAQVCLALRAAWRVGVLHLDVKPGNILSAGADGPFVLTDFGVARCLLNSDTSSSGLRPRPSERVAGTLQYMAPEQFENCVDHRSDMYALGLTLYYALSGRPAVVENTK